MIDIYDLLSFIVIYVLSIVLVIRSFAPFLYARILNGYKKGSLHGVAIIVRAGKLVQVEVADHSKPLGGWFKGKSQAYILQDQIIGNRAGIPISVHSSEDVTASFNFETVGEPVPTKTLDSFGQAAEEVGKIDQSRDMALVKMLVLISFIGIFLFGAATLYLLWGETQNTALGVNTALSIQSQISNLTSQIDVASQGAIIPAG